MNRNRAAFWLAGMAAAGLLAMPVTPARANNTGAAIAGGIVGLALGAAIAGSAQRDQQIYGPPPPAYAPPPPYSPAGGVICYPGQQTCYNNNGSVSWPWTSRIYGPR